MPGTTNQVPGTWGLRRIHQVPGTWVLLLLLLLLVLLLGAWGLGGRRISGRGGRSRSGIG